MPSALVQVDYGYSFPVAERWRHLYAAGVKEIVEDVFIDHVDHQQAPRIDRCEHDRWAWCDFNRAPNLLTWPDNIEALKRCHVLLSGHAGQK